MAGQTPAPWRQMVSLPLVNPAAIGWPRTCAGVRRANCPRGDGSVRLVWPLLWIFASVRRTGRQTASISTPTMPSGSAPCSSVGGTRLAVGQHFGRHWGEDNVEKESARGDEPLPQRPGRLRPRVPRPDEGRPESSLGPGCLATNTSAGAGSAEFTPWDEHRLESPPLLCGLPNLPGPGL